MKSTKIQWTDSTINPLRALNTETGAVGHYCEKVSDGCKFCYASAWNQRVRPIAGGKKLGTGLTFDVRNRTKIKPLFDTGKLTEVLRWSPRKIFWCDMTDVFGEWYPDDWRDQIFAAMALTPEHIHQVVTKRTAAALKYFSDPDVHRRIADAMDQPDWLPAGKRFPRLFENWPLPNLWLLASVENQEQADIRIHELLETPAALHGVSAEPLLGPVDFQRITPKPLDGWNFEQRLEWVIVGGESGAGARPCDTKWVSDIVEQCQRENVAVFVKQLGANPVQRIMYGPATFDADQAVHLDRLALKDRKGGDIAEWPLELQVREFPPMRRVE